MHTHMNSSYRRLAVCFGLGLMFCVLCISFLTASVNLFEVNFFVYFVFLHIFFLVVWVQFLVPVQSVSGKICLWPVLLCVEWDTKPGHSLTHSSASTRQSHRVNRNAQRQRPDYKQDCKTQSLLQRNTCRFFTLEPILLLKFHFVLQVLWSPLARYRSLGTW